MRPEALEALEGSDLILHAGDVGRDEVLKALEAIDPQGRYRVVIADHSQKTTQ